MTYELAHAASTDAANRSMRKHNRSAWNEEDSGEFVKEFNRLWPEERSLDEAREICLEYHKQVEERNLLLKLASLKKQKLALICQILRNEHKNYEYNKVSDLGKIIGEIGKVENKLIELEMQEIKS
jgi:hypothetical protein